MLVKRFSRSGVSVLASEFDQSVMTSPSSAHSMSASDWRLSMSALMWVSVDGIPPDCSSSVVLVAGTELRGRGIVTGDEKAATLNENACLDEARDCLSSRLLHIRAGPQVA